METTRAFVESAFLCVLAVSWQASILVVLIVAAQWLLRKRISAGWRYALWGLLLARLLLLWTPPAPFSVFNLGKHASRALETVSNLDLPFPDIEPSAAATPPEVPNIVQEHTFSFNLLQIGAAAWIVGILLMTGVVLAQQYRIRHRLAGARSVMDEDTGRLLDECRQRMAIRRPVTVLATPHVESPALLGLLRPRLLLPAGFLGSVARDHLRYVFLHELAHLKRGDILMGWLSYTLLAIHWFNPLIWWARRRWTIDRELACDARTLSVLKPDERLAYGHALLDEYQRATRLSWNPGWAGVLDGTTSIEKRLRMVGDLSLTARKGAVLTFLALSVLGATALTGAQTTSNVQRTSNAESAPAAEDTPAVQSTPSTEESPFEVAVRGRRYENTIGLYDRARAFSGWGTAIDGWSTLRAQRDRYQQELDFLSKKLENEKTNYEKVKVSLSAKAQTEREREIQAFYKQHSDTLNRRQQEIDEQAGALSKMTSLALEKALARVSAELGCTVVEKKPGDEWNKRAPRGKDYPPIVDITPLVIEELEKGDQQDARTES